MGVGYRRWDAGGGMWSRWDAGDEVQDPWIQGTGRGMQVMGCRIWLWGTRGEIWDTGVGWSSLDGEGWMQHATIHDMDAGCR